MAGSSSQAAAIEFANSSTVEATSRERVYRVERSKSRPTGELHQYAVGDMLESYRSPDSKDISGWKGPATITDTSQMQEVLFTIKWQSSIMSVRSQDCRRALVYPTFIAFPGGRSGIANLVSLAAGLDNRLLRLGYVYNGSNWSARKSE